MSEKTGISHDRNEVRSLSIHSIIKFIDNACFTKEQENFLFKNLDLTAAKLKDMKNATIQQSKEAAV